MKPPQLPAVDRSLVGTFAPPDLRSPPRGGRDRGLPGHPCSLGHLPWGSWDRRNPLLQTPWGRPLQTASPVQR